MLRKAIQKTMDLNLVKCLLTHGPLAGNLLLKALLFVSAMGIIPLLLQNSGPVDPDCPLKLEECTTSTSTPFHFPGGVLNFAHALSLFGLSLSVPFNPNGNVTLDAFKEIMGEGLLYDGVRAICVGEGSASAASTLRELGFNRSWGVHYHPFSFSFRKSYVYDLDYEDNSFDFVFSRALDRVLVPALLVLEIERVLRPGGTGAMLVGSRDLYPGGLIRSAMPVSSFLKSSDILNVRGIGSFTLVIFKRRFDSVSLLEHYGLPEECPSVTNNRPFMNLLEPLSEERTQPGLEQVSYLPKFMNITSRNKLIYINIGAAEYVSSSMKNWLKPMYPIRHQVPHVYVIDHNISVLSSYIKSPGITFVYHPELAGSLEYGSFTSLGELDVEPLDNEEFGFVPWFRETVSDGDFVVLAMNAREAELKHLFDLFESGLICHVDELFLRCTDGVDCKGGVCSDCMDLFQGLRNSGVFVHQWCGD